MGKLIGGLVLGEVSLQNFARGSWTGMRWHKRALLLSAAGLAFGSLAFATRNLVELSEYGWFGGQFSEGYSGLDVAIVWPGGPAQRAGIRSGEKISAIDGLRPSDPQAIARLAEMRPGGSATFSVEEPGGTRDVTVRAESPLRLPLVSLTLGAWFLEALCFAAAGAAISVRFSRSEAAWLFGLFAGTSAAWRFLVSANVWYLLGPASFLSKPVPTYRSPIYVVSQFLYLGLILPLLLHFSLAFPKARPGLKRRPILIWIYGSGVWVFLVTWAFWPIFNNGRRIHDWLIPALVASAVLLAVSFAQTCWRAVMDSPMWILAVLAVVAGVIAPVFLQVYGRDPTLFHAFRILAAILEGAPVVFAVLTCVALLTGYWSMRREERKPVRLAVWGIVLGLILEFVVDWVPLPRSVASKSLWHEIWRAGVPGHLAMLLIPLGVATLLWRLPKDAATLGG